jgi:hypothetical protein
MASLQNFRVTSNTVDEVYTRDGQKLQSLSQSRISVQRPNHVRTDRVGRVADVQFIYDGQNFSVIGNRTGYYATAPAPPTLDAAIDTLRDRLGIDIPGADLLNSNVYGTMMSDVRSGQYLGLEPVGGVQMHHLAFRADQIDWQLWVQDGAQPLPRRLVITSRDEPGSPEFTTELSNWEPNIPLRAEDFVFRAPRGATRIEFLTPGGPAQSERQGH